MDIDTDTLTGILASVSTLATVGLSGVVAHFRRLLAPLRGRGEIRVVLLCRPQHREAVAAQREELLALGYRQVTLTHAAAAAAAADVVALWLPEPATDAVTVGRRTSSRSATCNWLRPARVRISIRRFPRASRSACRPLSWTRVNGRNLPPYGLGDRAYGCADAHRTVILTCGPVKRTFSGSAATDAQETRHGRLQARPLSCHRPCR